MPLYEYQCPKCRGRTEVFVRSMVSTVAPPSCPKKGCGGAMERILSGFARHLTEAEKLVEAEAKYGKEVDAAMGPELDVGKYARRYERLAKDLPPSDIPPH